MNKPKVTRHWNREHQQYDYYIHNTAVSEERRKALDKNLQFHQEVESNLMKNLILEQVKLRVYIKDRHGSYGEPETRKFIFLKKMEFGNAYKYILRPKGKRRQEREIEFLQKLLTPTK